LPHAKEGYLVENEAPTTNSRESRVIPTFAWLEAHGGDGWPQRLVELAEGLDVTLSCGPLLRLECIKEREVEPSNERLAWMLQNAERLAPADGRRWRELGARVGNQVAVHGAIAALRDGRRSAAPASLCLEGSTHADCLIECERAFVWIEGKRFDWLSPSTTWDVTRDQLARNVEAAWSLANEVDKDFCVIICYESSLKHHEGLLIDGYRQQTWAGGWPHLAPNIRSHFAKRIGTLRWGQIADEWPSIREQYVGAQVTAS
jgi:hypothetical protein